MPDDPIPMPDNTAVRTALWRALHVLADPPPHVFDDTIGLELAAPEDGWRERPDMCAFTRPFRASILARAVSSRTWSMSKPRAASINT